MVRYRCAACGSGRVVVDERKEGFSIAKGVVGTALVGTGGAVMGLNGNMQLYYHCADCGQTLSYPMPNHEKMILESYLSNPQLYVDLLKEKKQRYPNIEWDETDIHIEEVLSNSNIDEKDTDEEFADAIWNYYLRTKISYIDEDTLFKKALGKNQNRGWNAIKILEERGVVTTEFVEDLFCVRFYSKTEDIKKNIYENQIFEISRQIYKANRSDLMNIFLEYIKGKREIDYDEVLDSLIAVITEKKYHSNKDVNNKLAHHLIGEFRKRYEIDIKYDEEKRSEMIIYLTETEARQCKEEVMMKIREQQNLERKPYLDAIMDLLKGDVKKSIPEMQRESKKLSELTNIRLSVYLKSWVEEGIFEKVIEKKNIYFCLPGVNERLKEKEKRMQEVQLEKIRRHNDEIRRNIKILEQEKEVQASIISKNKNKLFGFGAKARKNAQYRIEKIETEINILKQRFQ